ncbi:hypothetical protein AF306_15460 [Listeria monocytogenes]|nr:hypothetical protein [Listeria monocytogenes]EAD8590521.1 hypothetical protein [Listeria monocytogenes]EAD8593643.1 hypothetical protein [Listeria monocytogenes]EAD8602600.1 hypothetical protein [Listeria monocytogenes]
MSREVLKKEALARMEILKLHKHVIDDFDKENIVHYSERFIVMLPEEDKNDVINAALLNKLDGEMKEVVKMFEEVGNGDKLVYHLIISYTEFGKLFNLFYVDGNAVGNWREENKQLGHGMSFVYVVNMTYPNCSEFGIIGIESIDGGLIRKI